MYDVTLYIYAIVSHKSDHIRLAREEKNEKSDICQENRSTISSRKKDERTTNEE